MTARHTLAIVAAAFALGTPAAASAQTPGDEQYTDPFGGGTPSQPREREEGNGESQPETPDDEAGDVGGGTTGTPPAATTEPSAPASSADSTAPAAPAPPVETLPATGLDAGLLAVGGAILVAGGVALRLMVSERARRRR